MDVLSKSDEEKIKRGSSERWLNKKTGEVVFLEKGYDFSMNKDWCKIPDGAFYATYSNNPIRSNVTLFWKEDAHGCLLCFNPESSLNGWWKSGEPDLKTFLTQGTYKGKIVWSLYG